MGGAIVSAFAVIADVLKPKSFAGLFGAAPSVALATLILTVQSKGAAYAALEARSMLVGAVAFAIYGLIVCRVLAGSVRSVMAVAGLMLLIWFGIAFGLWAVALR